MNGTVPNGVLNAHPHSNGFHEPTDEELIRELPLVLDGQVPLGELVSRTVQTIYAELTELAETWVMRDCTELERKRANSLFRSMPNMSDSARKRTLADWVVKTKKQVVKLYAVIKWSRDADVVQKAMVQLVFWHAIAFLLREANWACSKNVTAFLMDQNRQFEDAIYRLKYAKESLDPAR